MKVAAIWRDPIKSMAGERVNAVSIDTSGRAGDCVVQVYDRSGRLVTARKYSRLLPLKATVGSDGEPVVDGFLRASSEAAERVAAAVEPGVRLRRFDGPKRCDILPLLVCTDGAVRLFTHDVRRLRPNLLIEGLGETAECGFPGSEVTTALRAIGRAITRPSNASLRRCEGQTMSALLVTIGRFRTGGDDALRQYVASVVPLISCTDLLRASAHGHQCRER